MMPSGSLPNPLARAANWRSLTISSADDGRTAGSLDGGDRGWTPNQISQDHQEAVRLAPACAATFQWEPS